MNKIFLTGGSGFLGGWLAASLLKLGHEVVFLSREARGKTARERIENMLGFVDKECLPMLNRCLVLEGDVTLPGLGLSSEDYASLMSAGITDVMHVAGSISFSWEKETETALINVEGTKNVLAMADFIHPQRLHHVSTAYVCGDIAGTFYERDLYVGQRFRNPYESTKAEAEQLVRNWAVSRSGVQTLICRPSIIVGDSTTGKTCGYSGYYTYMRAFHVISRGLRQHLSVKEGRIVFPVSVPGIAGSSLNIVPVDYVVQSIIDLMNKGVGGVYHLTADNPQAYGFWLEHGLTVLGISGVHIGESSELEDEKLRNAEDAIRRGVESYKPYITHQPTWDKSAMMLALNGGYTESPTVTPAFIKTLLEYAVKSGFKEPF